MCVPMLHLFLLALASLAPAQEVGDDLVADFVRFYDADRPRDDRIAMIRDLEGSDSLAAARALLVAFEDEDYHVRRAAVEVVAAMHSQAVARWLTDTILLERKMAKRTLLRAGVAEAVGGLGHAFVLDPLLGMLGERAAELRLAAIAGLGRLGDARACPALGTLAVDADGALAIAALEALTRIGAVPAVRAPVVSALGHEAKRVRLKAIQASLRLRLKQAVRPLILALRDDPDARVQEDAYEALKLLTLRDFSEDPEPWLRWWDRNEKVFELPDLEAIQAARRKLAETGTQYHTGKSFATIETLSENILFVIDVSRSMETPFGDPARLQASGRQYRSLDRMGIVKEELAYTIQELPDTTRFNILAFATDVRSWKKRPALATNLNRKSASSWVSKLKPQKVERATGFVAKFGGGGSRDGGRGSSSGGGGRGGAGGAPAAGAAARISDTDGQTNTHLALMTALGAPLKGKAAQTAVLDPARHTVDTIFFLTDGEPTFGKTVDMNEIRAEVRRVNAYRGVQIHVIYVGNQGGKDMRYLAEENQGVFVAIGG